MIMMMMMIISLVTLLTWDTDSPVNFSAFCNSGLWGMTRSSRLRRSNSWRTWWIRRRGAGQDDAELKHHLILMILDFLDYLEVILKSSWHVFHRFFHRFFPSSFPCLPWLSLQIVSELLALHVATLLLERVTEVRQRFSLSRHISFRAFDISNFYQICWI